MDKRSYHTKLKQLLNKGLAYESPEVQVLNAEYSKKYESNPAHANHRRPGGAQYAAVSKPPNAYAEAHITGRDTNEDAITGNVTYAYRGDSNNNNRNSEEK